LNRSPDETVIGHLEDRSFLVLVDGDDDLRVLHAGEMLDRARDPDRDVEVGSDDLAGLADLPVVRARIRHRPPRAEAPIAAPSLSAIGSMYVLKFSVEPTERPPEMMIFAAVSSGRSLCAIASPLKARGPNPRRLTRSRRRRSRPRRPA
jgi:hypothetical protein